MLIAQRYQIIKELGSGGFGITYLVQDIKLPGQPPRVLKQLKIPPSQPPQVQQKIKNWFDREADKLGQLGSYDQIPNIFDYFEENQQLYLVQEYIAGNNLETELAGRRLSETEVILLLQQILEVLTLVHQHNIIHRDLKPANLIRRQRDGKLVLIDFGAVKEINTILIQQSKASSGTWAIGTPGYMPDEQAKGHPKLSSDVYAVGMIGIQALTGTQPYNLQFDPNTLEVSWRNLVQVSDSLVTVLETMVRVDFNKRYNSAKEALESVKSLINPVQVIVNSNPVQVTSNQSNIQSLFKFVPPPQKIINLPH